MAVAGKDTGPARGRSHQQFHHWHDPDPHAIGATAVEFLHRLQGPTCIHLTGGDRGRCRVVATLLHGNEPSGLFALFELLRLGLRPAVNLLCFIPSVDAAKRPPGFSHRMLPRHKDLNRCFGDPPEHFPGGTEVDRIAREMMELIDQARPECVVDIHNTSGSSPSFGISTVMAPRHAALIALFTQRMIITDLRLDSLMERTRSDMPIVTIECGGAWDRESALLAGEGLRRYFSLEDVFEAGSTGLAGPAEMPLEYFHHPMRLELAEGSAIAYGEHSLVEDGVTLLPSVENHNFGQVCADTPLGFVAGELGDKLRLRNGGGAGAVGDYFRLEQGRLYPRRRLKLFMVTTNPEIARKDCVFYLTEA